MLSMRRHGDALVPANNAARIELERLPANVRLRVTAKQERNGDHHRKFWAFLTYVADAMNAGPANTTPEQVLKWLKIRMGYFRTVDLPRQDAQIAGADCAIEYESIAFDAMDQAEFSAFYDQALSLIEDQLCPYLMQSDHKSEVLAIIADNRRAA